MGKQYTYPHNYTNIWDTVHKSWGNIVIFHVVQHFVDIAIIAGISTDEALSSRGQGWGLGLRHSFGRI